MFTTIEQSKKIWQQESSNTKKIFSALTDDSLDKNVAEEHRTLGRMAWHIALSIPEMAGHVGLKVEGPAENSTVPKTAAEILKAYEQAASSLIEQITQNWTDETLKIEDDLYGERWTRGVTLQVLLFHEIHHRAQMTVLMRQAGLKVPGIYGPSKEEWTQYGAPEPAV